MEKNKSLYARKIGLATAALCFTFLLTGTQEAEARDGHRNYHSRYNNQRYYTAHDRNVYRDRHGNYRRYEYRNNRRGYWSDNGGLRFWINLN